MSFAQEGIRSKTPKPYGKAMVKYQPSAARISHNSRWSNLAVDFVLFIQPRQNLFAKPWTPTPPAARCFLCDYGVFTRLASPAQLLNYGRISFSLLISRRDDSRPGSSSVSCMKKKTLRLVEHLYARSHPDPTSAAPCKPSRRHGVIFLKSSARC